MEINWLREQTLGDTPANGEFEVVTRRAHGDVYCRGLVGSGSKANLQRLFAGHAVLASSARRRLTVDAGGDHRGGETGGADSGDPGGLD